MKSYLAIDAGTTAVKILLADETGRSLFTGELPVTVIQTAPGSAEMDMEAYWAALCRLTRRAASACPAAWQTLQGVCAAGQGDGLWPLDSAGNSFMPAILWRDTRAVQYCDAASDLSWQYNSNRLQPGCRGAVLAWLREHRRKAYDRIALPLGCVSFLNKRLTDAAVTDASCCGDCFDILAGAYVPALYDRLGIGDMTAKLPPVLPCDALIGCVTAAAARQTGLPEGTPVYNGCLDATAAVMGGSRLREGCVSICAGTTLLVMAAQQEPPVFPLPDGVYADRLPYALPLYRMCFAPGSGASAIAAEKARYAPETDYEAMYRRIETIPMGCGGLTYLPFLHGERSPFYCPQAQAGYYGAMPEHTVWHRLRAAAEGVLFAARHCLDALGRTFTRAELTGGAARSPVFCQMASDILGIPVEVGQGVYAGVGGCLAIMRKAEGYPIEAPGGVCTQIYRPAPECRAAAEDAYGRYRQIVAHMLQVWKTAEYERR